MKNFKEYLDENWEPVISKEELEDKVVETWKKVFPNSHISIFKTSLGNDTRSLITCYLMKNTSEWINGISQNDPLRLSFSIAQSPKGFVIEYSSNSYSVAPDQKHMAFGRHKIPLRKTTIPDGPFMVGKLLFKLEDMFRTVKKEGQKAQAAGKFSVYDDNQQELIAKKLK